MIVWVIQGAVAVAAVIGAFVTWAKLNPDKNTAAVTQAQGAAETMAVLQRELIQDRDAWRNRALSAESECLRLATELDDCQRAHGRRARDRPKT